MPGGLAQRGPRKRAELDKPGPWEKWKGSRAGKAIRFIETYCRPPKGIGWGQPLKLLPWQREWIDEILADGVDAAVLSIARGNGKSTYAAGLAVWAVFADNGYGAPVVPIIAVTVGQATRSVYSVVSSMIAHEPELKARSLTFTGIGTSRITVPRTEGMVFPISADVGGLQGLDISLAICDEIGFIKPVSWTALMMARKRPGALVYGTGTPGLDRDNALWMIRELSLSGGRPESFRYREFAADPGSDPTNLKQLYKANPSMKEGGFPTRKSLETDRKMSPASHYEVFHRGLWVEGVECWLGPDGYAIWRGLEAPMDTRAGDAAWIGVDVGIKRDSTAVCIVQKRLDGGLHAWTRLWIPTKDEPVDVTDVMAHLRSLCDTYKVGAISFDPRFFDVPAKLLYDSGLPMVEVPQSVERMTPIIGNLYERIKNATLSHDADPKFEHQILNAVARINERGFTLSKGKSRGRIDAAVALALAVDRADHAVKKVTAWAG